MLPAQLARRQEVAAPGNVQTGVPPHEPWQTPDPAHAPREPWGAPLGTFEHAPTEPPTSHAWHCEVQVELQHTPSTQWPLKHCASAPQPWPLALRQVSVPLLQLVPAAQATQLAPQEESARLLTQEPPHWCWPPGHEYTHEPPEHEPLPPDGAVATQLVQLPPQWLLSLLR